MLFAHNFWSVALVATLCSSSVFSLAMESQPREAAPAEAVEATTKPCSPASRFPPVSPQLRNMDANQSQQYTYINTTLTAFYGNTIKTRNPDDSFTGPFGQLLYTTPAIIKAYVDLNVGVAKNLPAIENEACVLAILSIIKAPFAIYAHTILAQKAGFTLKQVQTMLAGKVPADITPRQKAAYILAVKITNLKAPLDAASWKTAVAALGLTGVEGVTQQTAASLLSIIMLNVGDVGVPPNA